MLTRLERLVRTDEVDMYADWLTDHDPREYLEYHRARTQALDAVDTIAAPIMPGETLEVHIAGHIYKVKVERAL